MLHGFYGGLMGGVMNSGSACGNQNSQALTLQEALAQQNMYQYQAPQLTNGSLQDALKSIQNPRTAQIPGKKMTMFGSIKKYFDDHRDLLMTMLVLVVVDQFVFDGAFKEKIKQLIDRVIGHAEGKIKQLDAVK